MQYPETINYYCFNPGCNNSIFKSRRFSGVNVPANSALLKPQKCSSCNTEMISKADLVIRAEINAIFQKNKPLQAIVIDDDPFFHLIAENSLKQDLSITEARYNYNGADAIDYLRAHKKMPDFLPDFIFVDIQMPVMDGWGFLNEYQKLFDELDKKSMVYITSGFINAENQIRTQNYAFVKGVIPKPFTINTLKHISLDMVPID